MASVFLSYDRDDSTAAGSIARALEKAGHSVWWDRHIKGGTQYAKEIEQALAAAEAVVVLWSRNAVESAWVRDEAAAGRDTGRLVPVRLDVTEPPLGFRQYQTIDFLRTRGSQRARRLQELLQAVESVVPGAAGARKPPIASSIREPRLSRLGWSLLVALVIGVLVGAGYLLWRSSLSPSSPTVAVAAADDTPYARALARDLVVKLGRIQAANPASMNLIGEGERERKSSFVFEVGGSIRGLRSEANLVLLAPGGRSILWSKDFEQPREKEADLRQQVAVSGASVLDCAQDAITSETEVDQQTLKLYLNGCATLAEVYYHYAGVVIPMFLEVTKRAPRFKGGWAKLLLAEAEVAATDSTLKGAAIASALPRHIQAARALDPQMAEAYYADIQLLPGSAFKQQIQIADKALALHPDNPALLGLRAGLLQGLGRMNEAVAEAKKAAELDALSPTTRSDYITTLANAGYTESALAELKQGERLWPDTGPMIDARFRVHARYGDPRVSLRILRSIQEPGMPAIFEAFLLARIDPTPANVDRAIADATGMAASNPDGVAFLIQALGEFGREELIYDAIMTRPGADIDAINYSIFRPALRKFRRDPRFIRVAARTGLVDYWQKSGKWPDFCSESDLPYDCKAEAAKLAR